MRRVLSTSACITDAATSASQAEYAGSIPVIGTVIGSKKPHFSGMLRTTRISQGPLLTRRLTVGRRDAPSETVCSLSLAGGSAGRLGAKPWLLGLAVVLNLALFVLLLGYTIDTGPASTWVTLIAALALSFVFEVVYAAAGTSPGGGGPSGSTK